MFQSSGFNPTDISVSCPDGSKGTAELFTKDPFHVLQEQISVLQQSNDFLPRPIPQSNRSNNEQCQNQPMQTSYFHDIDASIARKVSSSHHQSSIWNDNDPSLPRSTVGFLQVFSDKTASTLSSSSFVAYLIHIVLLNKSPRKRDWIIDNGYSILGFLPVSTSDMQTDEVDVD